MALKLELDPLAENALAYILDENERAIRKAFEGRDFGDAVCAMCMYDPPDEVLEAEEHETGGECQRIGSVSIETAGHRAKKLAESDMKEPLLTAWNGDFFTYEYEPLSAPTLTSPAFRRAEAVLGPALWSLVDESEGAIRTDADLSVFGQLAYCLTASPPVPDTTNDFVVFYGIEDFGDDLLESIRSVASPKVCQRLREQGIFFDTYEDSLRHSG